MEVKGDVKYKVFFNHEAGVSDKNTKEEVFLSKFYGVTNVVIGKTRTFQIHQEARSQFDNRAIFLIKLRKMKFNFQRKT